MRIQHLVLLLLIAIGTSGCIVPINSTFEGAKMLEKEEIEIQGSYSNYFVPDNEPPRTLNNNFGFAVGMGLSDQVNMKFRYERIVTDAFNSFGDEISIDGGINYVELGTKFRIIEDELAFSLPLGIYLLDDEPLFQLDPKFLITVIGTDKFEFNVIPKGHIFFGNPEVLFGANPLGLNIGLAFSDDLNKWAIRPEVGWDGYFTAGVAINYYFNQKLK